MTKIISVGGRSSPLSRVQVDEVLNELRQHHPAVDFKTIFTETIGDKDQLTSLRTLGKTDFFTKEIDALVLSGQCRIGIHSAKDLPDPLPEGLALVALTRGVDPSDSLVLKPGATLENLPLEAVIATSSVRREEAVRQMRPDVRFVDIRGTIGQRLSKLEAGAVDGVVIAEAALIRLGLTHLNRSRIPGDTTPYQGQLAVLARCDDTEMRALFRCIDSRRKVLFLGLKSPQNTMEKSYLHYPVIRILPRSKNHPDIREALNDWPHYTHVIFTSQSASQYFDPIQDKVVIAVGKMTASTLPRVDHIAEEEHAEGIIALLEKLDLRDAYVFWPHSALSRPVITDYLIQRSIRHRACVVYDTEFQKPQPVPDLSEIDEIAFTSPSTVDAFCSIYGTLPQDKSLTCIGPITKARIQETGGGFASKNT